MESPISPSRPRSPRRTWLRVAFYSLAGLALITGIGLWFGRDRLLDAMVRPAIEEETGGTIDLTGLRWTGLGEVGFDDLTIKVAGWSGPAGEVLRVQGLRASIQILPLLIGEVRFNRIDVEQARLRIAEKSDDPGMINLASLQPPDTEESDDQQGGTNIGIVDIRELLIEVGIDDGTTFDRTSIENFNVRIEPIQAEESMQGFLAIQQKNNEESPTLIKGWWNPDTMAFELRMDDLDLAEGSALAMSATARAFCEKMQLEGLIERATISWRPGTEPQAELKVQEVAMTMPDELGLGEHWVRFQRGRIAPEPPPLPRMKVREGTIELDGNRVAFRGFRGELVSSNPDDSILPVGIQLEFETWLGLPGNQDDSPETFTEWSREMLENAPFKLAMTIDDFVHKPSEESAGLAVELPRSVARALENLQAMEWDLAATANAWRGSFDEDDGESTNDIQTHAEIYLAEGRGGYIKFPYPLVDVSGHLVVKNDQVLIDYVSGRGPAGDNLTITGRLDGVDRDAGVQLQLRAARIPMDDILLESLPPKTRSAVSHLFDKLAFERLSEAGILPTEEEVDAQRERQRELRNLVRLASNAEDLEAADQLREDLKHADALITAGVFELGGMASIDLDINRAQGPDKPVIVEGTIDLRNVGSIFDQFPYPVTVTSGRLVLEDQAIVLQDPGLNVITLGGGRGRISGRIDIPRRADSGTEPDLSFVIEGDTVNPGLLAAIPPDVEQPVTAATLADWPGIRLAEAVQPLVEIGLGGPLDCHARVEHAADGSTDIHATLFLENGTIRPPQDIAPVTDLGRNWPRGLELDACNALLLIAPDSVKLKTFEGARGTGTMTAEGVHDRATRDIDAQAFFENFKVEPYMQELFPPATRPAIAKTWEDWQPDGRLDAEVVWTGDADQDHAEVKVTPYWIGINAGGTSQVLQRESGTLFYTPGRVEADELMVSVQGPPTGGFMHLDGAWVLDESFASATDERSEGRVDFNELLFQSPLVEETLRMVAGTTVSDVWQARQPEGVFSGWLISETGGPNARQELELSPRRFTLLSNPDDPSSRAGGAMAEGARIHYRDDAFAISSLDVTSENGTRIELDAEVTNLSIQPSITANWSITTPSSQLPETRLLPPPLSVLLGDEGIATGNMKSNGSVAILLGIDQDAPTRFLSVAEMQFEAGRIDLGGVEVTGMNGQTKIDLMVEDGVVSRLQSNARIPSALIENRKLTNMILETTLAEPSGDELAVVITMKDGTLYEGPIRGSFTYQPDSGRYRVQASMDDVALAGLAAGETEARLTGPPGRVLASLGMEGITGADETRVGRGKIIVRDASIAGGDGSMAILRLGQLMPPSSKGLDEAEISFLVDGSEAILDRIVLDSPSLKLVGEGRMRISDFQMAVRLTPKGQLGAVSDLVSAVTGTVYAIDVEGTPGDPKTSITPLPIIVSPPDLEPVPRENTKDPS